MSKLHTWVQKHIESYVAGGLSSRQRERVEQHTAECSECATTLAEVRAFDAELGRLFADVQPTPTMEDRLLRSFRVASRRRFPVLVKVAMAAAAVLLLVFGGAGLSALIDQKRMVFPSEKATYPLVLFDKSESMSVSERSYFGQFSADDAHNKLPSTVGWYPARNRQHGLDARSTKGYGTTFYHSPGEGRDNLKDADAIANELADAMLSLHGWQSTDPKIEGKSVVTITDGVDKTADELEKVIEGYKTAMKGSESPPSRIQFAPVFVSPNMNWAVPNKSLLGQPLHQGKSFDPSLVFPQFRGPDPGKKLEPISNKDQSGGKKGKEKGIGNPKEDKKKGGQDQGKQANKQPAQGRKIIRTGEVDFEVKSFDKAVATINKLLADTKSGFVATVNSDKLPNGKMRGSVVVRVQPEKLTAFVLALRKSLDGELISQSIGSKDITKTYYDIESHLKAARTMEERLLKIIKDGKGQIKDLLLAEKELGVWREKIEGLEGEIRYYNNLVSLGTLTISLSEKEIQTAAKIEQCEHVTAGIEVEKVEQRQRELEQQIVKDASGRVTKSELKQLSGGQFHAEVHFEVPYNKTGPVLDKLNQLGRVARMEKTRVQQTPQGAPAPKNGTIEYGDTQFFISLYNLANVAPRETVTLRLATKDVATVYEALRTAVTKAEGRIVDALLNEQDRRNVTAQLHFTVHRDKEAAVRAELTNAGVILARSVTRSKEDDKVTDTKRAYAIELLPAANIDPRETVTLALVVDNVDTALTTFKALVKEAGGRAVNPKISRERNGRITAKVLYDVPLSEAFSLVQKMQGAGEVRWRNTREDDRAPTGKLARAHIELTVSNQTLLVPQDEGLWTQIRRGLSISFRGLAWSVSWLIVAVLFVLPWVIVLAIVIWLVRRFWGTGRQPGIAASTATTTDGGDGSS